MNNASIDTLSTDPTQPVSVAAPAPVGAAAAALDLDSDLSEPPQEPLALPRELLLEPELHHEPLSESELPENLNAVIDAVTAGGNHIRGRGRGRGHRGGRGKSRSTGGEAAEPAPRTRAKRK